MVATIWAERDSDDSSESAEKLCPFSEGAEESCKINFVSEALSQSLL
jgi:hypothetical protein